MKNLTLLLVALAASFSLYSCGGEQKPTTNIDKTPNSEVKANAISPLDVNFQGDLRDYFEIVDKEYKPKTGILNDIYYEVEIRRLNKPLPLKKGENIAGWNDEKGLLIKFCPDFFDENGDRICNGCEYGLDAQQAKINPGETTFIEVKPLIIRRDAPELSKIVKFKITSTMEHNVPEGKESSYSSSSSDDDASDEDYDKALDEAKKTMEVVGGAAKALGELSKSL